MKNVSAIRKIAMYGVLAAIYVILSYLSVGTNDFKISFESLSILMAGLCFGPVGGLCVGLVGELIHQVLLYGVDPTTPLWLLPYIAYGLVSGFISKSQGLKPDKKHIFIAIIASEITLSAIVTPVNWASAVIQGWGSWPLIAAGIPLRLAIMFARIVIYRVIVPPLFNGVRKVVK